jgi:hypothetical protein
MKKPSAATVIATLALFVALGGTGYAAVALAPNSVGSPQIKDGAVQSSDIKDGAINSSDIANGAIGSDDIKSGSIQVSDLSKGALKGLDGKDGKDGAQGPAGPPGPAGPSGSGGGASGGLVLLDGNGNEVTGIQPGIDSGFVIIGTLDMSPTSFSGQGGGFVRYLNDALWVMQRDGTYYPAGKYTGGVYFHSEDCTGTVYIPVGDDLPFLQTTLLGSQDGGAAPARNYLRRTEATDTYSTGAVWSRYTSYAQGWTGQCRNTTQTDDFPPPPNGREYQAYATTTADSFPTPPAVSTPPFSWSAG